MTIGDREGAYVELKTDLFVVELSIFDAVCAAGGAAAAFAAGRRVGRVAQRLWTQVQAVRRVRHSPVHTGM